ncbi:MAG: tol-pal system-associated acyl-CoA thioesterase [Candidatus Competibacteraceae bacterium]|jgi:acyl-CoA thioester hydrolase|nr:tol-pal system-associated acyl-CoA thioesterase [Candidatus Competibacteraceae bacterium]
MPRVVLTTQRRVFEVNLFIWPVRVYYEDTDSGGVVYYANYLKFMERARTEWLRSFGIELDALGREAGIMFVVRRVNIDYHRPARFNDLLQVRTRLAQTGRASMVFEQKIRREQDSEQDLLCAGHIKVACVAIDSLKPRPVPRSILTEIFDDS